MRVLLGIDTMRAWQSTANLLVRLFPDGFDAELLHCIESVLPDSSFPSFSQDHPLTLIYEEHRLQGEEALDEASTFLTRHGVHCKKTMCEGNSSRVITEIAEKENCGLIAIRSSIKSQSEALFFGSTAKALVLSAKLPLLIVKNDHADSGTVDALLSTDHSPYMKSSIERMQQMNGLLFGNLTVFTTNETRNETMSFLLKDLPDIADLAPKWIKEKLEQSNQEIADNLSNFATNTDVLVSQENIRTALPNAIKETQSELLVMGSQGHNFFERIMLGSQSMHQILHEKTSVLLLKADKI
ncbi:MAG: universal stress protein [Fimbriimonadaceae bacterium]